MQTLKSDRQCAPSVVIVTYPDARILGAFGPLEVLTGTKFSLPDVPERYAVSVVASQAGQVPTTYGPSLTANPSFDEAGADTRRDRPADR